jgi:hypothetical protein
VNRRAYDCAWLIAAAIRKDKPMRCTIGLLLAQAATVAYGADFEAYRDANIQ